MCRAKSRQVAEPAAAFGPAGSTGEQNLSVIVAPVRAGFQLRSLGQPEEAAQQFLDNTIAPRSTDITARLIAASQRYAPQAGFAITFTSECEADKLQQ